MTVVQKRHPPEPPATYDSDYYGWLIEQAALLDAGGNAHADWPNIAEALRDLGIGEVRRLESALRVLAMHLLKWDFQPPARTRSWVLTIRIQRVHVTDLIGDSGSLRNKLGDVLARAYTKVRLEAADETGLSEGVFPQHCPYSFDEMMTRDIPWPPQD